MAPTFRPAEARDLDALLLLYRSLHPADSEVEPALAAATYQEILASPHLDIYLLDDEGTIVGTAYLNTIPNLTRGASPYAVIENVVVTPERRGSGLGKQLMAGMLSVAWQAGCYKAMLWTGSSSPAVHGFYERAGFSRHEKTAYVAKPS